jgi:hypothetical protein
MLLHCRARRISNEKTRSEASRACVPQTSPAVRAQAQGVLRLAGLSTMRRTPSLPSIATATSRSLSNAPTNTPLPSTATSPPSLPDLAVLPQPTAAEKATQEAEELARDRRTVSNELYRYKEDPILDDVKPLDLLQYWDVCLSFSLNNLLGTKANLYSVNCWQLGIREDISTHI